MEMKEVEEVLVYRTELITFNGRAPNSNDSNSRQRSAEEKKREPNSVKKNKQEKEQEQEEQEEAENLFLWRWAGRRGASTVSVSVGGTFGLSTLTPQSMATDGPAPIASSPFRFTSFYWVLMDVSRFYRILPGITGFGMDFAKFFLKIILSFFKQSLQASCGIRIGFF